MDRSKKSNEMVAAFKLFDEHYGKTVRAVMAECRVYFYEKATKDEDGTPGVL
ncbi:hypothetical protein [Liquorilactobacillus satsumensis]|uniref:hypothetical protein n=1 Tax=Liquorilactobacillus satsumensis TaxID=259059 RepID=UPI0021C3D410|nr:hypothetical protein [Liquorilactobacillus satsumensis]MCP9328237.1 hypothetical protein [Liquorilactobacillus satsumensis]